MDKRSLVAAERRIWEAVREAAPRATGVQLINPWNKLFGPLQVPVGIHGDGLLGWIPDVRLAPLRAVSAGLVYGDSLQVMLISSEAATVPVDMTLLITSSWSRAGIPLTQAREWPEGVVLGLTEQDMALAVEADYLSLWLDNGHLLSFRADEYRRSEIEAMNQRLRDPEFQQAYLTPGGLDDLCPRHARNSVCRPPDRRFFAVHRAKDGAQLPRRPVRLFNEHWLYEVLNVNDPIPYLPRSAPTWEPSPTSPSTGPESC